MKFILIALFLACVSAQSVPEDAAVTGGDAGANGVAFVAEWPQNNDRLAGAEGTIAFTGSNEDVCTITFPSPVEFFHPYNTYFIPNSYVGNDQFQITPAKWAANATDFGFVINFMNGTDGEPLLFNATDIGFTCGEGESDLGIYSVNSDADQDHQLLNIQNRPGFHIGDILYVSFPSPVINVTLDTQINGTTWTPADLSGPLTEFTVENFAHNTAEGEYVSDEATQFHGHFQFISDDERFSSDQITVTVTSA